jgi:hypothetical protein
VSGQLLFSLAVLSSLLKTALLCVWTTAVFTGGFSIATQNSAALCLDNSCFHWRFYHRYSEQRCSVSGQLLFSLAL